MATTSPDSTRRTTAAGVTAYRPVRRREVGWVVAAVAVVVLLLAVASPLAAPAGSAGTLITALFVLALALGGVALTYLLPARRR